MKKIIKLKESDIEYLVKRIISEEKSSQLSLQDRIDAYISYYMNGDISVIFDILGMDMPTELEGDEYEEIIDEARYEAQELFTKHPELMVDKYGQPFDFSKIN